MVSNWTASLNKRVFKCWDWMAPGVCLPEMAPSLYRPPLSSSHRPLLLSSLISLIKDICCSPAVMALRQQIRQSAHIDLVVRQRQTKLQVDKGKSCRYKLHTRAHFLLLNGSKIHIMTVCAIHTHVMLPGLRSKGKATLGPEVLQTRRSGQLWQIASHWWIGACVLWLTTLGVMRGLPLM